MYFNRMVMEILNVHLVAQDLEIVLLTDSAWIGDDLVEADNQDPGLIQVLLEDQKEMMLVMRLANQMLQTIMNRNQMILVIHMRIILIM